MPTSGAVAKCKFGGVVMRAHVIDNGVVVNTVEISLDVLPGLVAASGNEGVVLGLRRAVFYCPHSIVTTIVPQEITMRQARLALLDIGFISKRTNGYQHSTGT